MWSEELSYVSARDPRWKRWMMRAIENLSGRRRLLPIYQIWRSEIAGRSPRMFGDLLDLIGARLDISGNEWPAKVAPDVPLVMIANHPFGISDGIVVLALAEQLNRPYRILIYDDVLRTPEIRPFGLPVDFSETREAIKTNLKTRAEARRLLKDGVTIIVFPAGGVATADHPFGKAEELPWKTFTARLIQQAEASVLPIYFEGQNSALFHFVSHYSLTLRLSLLMSEFRRRLGVTAKVHVGRVLPYDGLAYKTDRRQLTAELYAKVHELAPGATSSEPVRTRVRYRWERLRRSEPA